MCQSPAAGTPTGTHHETWASGAPGASECRSNEAESHHGPEPRRGGRRGGLGGARGPGRGGSAGRHRAPLSCGGHQCRGVELHAVRLGEGHDRQWWRPLGVHAAPPDRCAGAVVTGRPPTTATGRPMVERAGLRTRAGVRGRPSRSAVAASARAMAWSSCSPDRWSEAHHAGADLDQPHCRQLSQELGVAGRARARSRIRPKRGAGEAVDAGRGEGVSRTFTPSARSRSMSYAACHGSTVSRGHPSRGADHHIDPRHHDASPDHNHQHDGGIDDRGAGDPATDNGRPARRGGRGPVGRAGSTDGKSD